MRVVIAEDEALLRQGLRLLLEDGGFDVVAAVGDAHELMAAVGEHRPDLGITDIRMPPSNNDEGLRAALRIRETHPDTAIVVLSQHVQQRYAIELLDGRAARLGYLLKQRIADIHAFRDDLRRVVDGGTALDPEIVAVLMSRAGRGAGVVRELTPRQREVLAYMAEGRSNAWIGHRLVQIGRASCRERVV